MYNIEVSIGSYKIRLGILFLIIIFSWIMFGHILCGCSKVGLLEGMEIMKEGIEKKNAKLTKDIQQHNIAEDTTVETATTTTEGFVGTHKSIGTIMNPAKWSLPSLNYSPGTTPNIKEPESQKQQLPLPEGELDIFANTEFKPECCPNAYSSSNGCACITNEQVKFIKNRGFNNVPYSEY